MASYLLLEDGSKIILEDSSGFLLLEAGDEPVFPAQGNIKHFPYGWGVTMKHIVHPYHVFTTRY